MNIGDVKRIADALQIIIAIVDSIEILVPKGQSVIKKIAPILKKTGIKIKETVTEDINTRPTLKMISPLMVVSIPLGSTTVLTDVLWKAFEKDTGENVDDSTDDLVNNVSDEKSQTGKTSDKDDVEVILEVLAIREDEALRDLDVMEKRLKVWFDVVNHYLDYIDRKDKDDRSRILELIAMRHNEFITELGCLENRLSVWSGDVEDRLEQLNTSEV